MTSAAGQGIDPRIGCSTISLRKLALPEALARIAAVGFDEIDLGALPGVCGHVPAPLPPEQVDPLAAVVADSGLRVRTVNADIGPLDDAGLTADLLARRLDGLLRLTNAVRATALVLPCGSPGTHERPKESEDIDAVAAALRIAADIAARQGVTLYVEAWHSLRLCHDRSRALRLVEKLAGASIGVVLDVSHVVAGGGNPVEAARAFAGQVRHVHLRDAVPGDIHRSVGRGDVDFAGFLGQLERDGYRGHYSLELETADVADEDRPAEAARAGHAMTVLLTGSLMDTP